MLLSFVAVACVLAGWALLARRLERWRITAPLFLVVAGAAVEFTTHDSLADRLNTDLAEHIAEIILAILLFIDATDVRGGLFGDHPRSAMRMLFIALPVSLALSVVVGLWLLPGASWAVLVVIACVVVPIDFAPATSILRDERLPGRVRDVLNVEAGYNDGVVSPVFIFALALAGTGDAASTPLHALGSAVPQALTAIVVGVVVGTGLALGANTAERRALTTAQSRRLVVVTAPVLAYTVSLGVDGNGFVAAFVCGIAYHYLRDTPDIRVELELLDDIGFLLAAGMWFVFGGFVVLCIWMGVPWATVMFCVLALTAVRMVPVALAMLGSTFSWPERFLLGWLGPRGTTSIVFGLLAFNILEGTAEHDVMAVMVVAVLGSVLLHGVGAPAAARMFARPRSE